MRTSLRRLTSLERLSISTSVTTWRTTWLAMSTSNSSEPSMLQSCTEPTVRPLLLLILSTLTLSAGCLDVRALHALN